MATTNNNTTTGKQIKGWTNIYAPKTIDTDVSAWLRENGQNADADNIKQGTTFRDFARCITERGTAFYRVDSERCQRLTRSGYCDSFLRDIIFDALREIEQAPTL